MGRRSQHWLLLFSGMFALLYVILVAAAWLIFSGERGWSRADVLGGAAVVAAVGGAILTQFGTPLFERWLNERSGRAGLATASLPSERVADRSAEQVALDADADLLARAAKDQWTRAAADRRLLAPAPIPVRWRRSALPVAGPVSEAVGSKKIPPRFSPLPGLAATTAARLRSGQLQDLHAVYGGLGSGRLVIVGQPGSGKTSAAVLLVLAALAHRDQVAAEDRPRVPVPVLLTLQRWDPNRERLEAWLVARLAETYPLFAGKRGAAKAGALVAAGRLAVILDGLDELGETLRPVALRALSEQAVLRVVVLTRSAEMVAAASKAHLVGAAAIELQDVEARVAADYLTRVQVDPPPPGWSDLISHLRHAPNSPIADALSAPLTLTLLRDTYRADDDIHELLDLADGAVDHHPAHQSIESHLLARVLPAAYLPRPGDPPTHYDHRTAERALRYIARRLNQDGTRDLRWWLIPHWMPSMPRFIVTGLVFGLMFRLLGGLVGGIVIGIVIGIVGGIVGGLAGGLAGEPHPLTLPLRSLSKEKTLAVAVAVGLLIGLTEIVNFGLAAGLPLGFALWLVIVLAIGLQRSLRLSMVDNSSPLSPLASWRSDRGIGARSVQTAGLRASMA